MARRFVKLYVDLLRDDHLGPTSKLVCAYLEDLTLHNPQALLPCLAQMEHDLGTPRRAISRAMKSLEKTGLLSRGRPAHRKRRPSACRFSCNSETLFSRTTQGETPKTGGLLRPKTDVLTSPDGLLRPKSDVLRRQTDRVTGEHKNVRLCVSGENGAKTARKEIVGILREQCFPADIRIERAEHNRIGRAASMLVRADVTADELKQLIEAYRDKWPKIDLTPLGIANNVTTLRVHARGLHEESSYDREALSYPIKQKES